jgi:polyphosphate kinase
VFYFRNGGHVEVYLSSADWMRRNLSKRLELLFPVIDPKIRRRLIEALTVYFADNANAWRLSSDGAYQRVARKAPRVRAQQTFYREAVAAVREAAHATPQFRPLARPEL